MVNISMISRAKFSLEAPLTLTPASRNESIAGSCATATVRSRKLPVPCFWNSSNCAEELAVVANLGFVGSEMAVPEQRHLFLQRPRAGQHPIGPPIGHAVGFENAGAQPVEEFIDDGLQAAIAGGLDLDAERLAFLLGQVRDGRTAGRKRLQSRIVNSGMIEGRQLAGVGPFEADQARDRLRRGQFRQSLDFLGSAAESGALEQVRREIVIPIRGTDGGQIVLPGGGAGGLGASPRRRNRAARNSSRRSMLELLVTCLGRCSHEWHLDATGMPATSWRGS